LKISYSSWVSLPGLFKFITQRSADVVHECALAHDFHGVVREPHARGQVHRVERHPLGVPRGVAIHLVDGARQALDGLPEGRPQILVQARVLDGRRRPGGHDGQQFPLPLVEAAVRVKLATATQPSSRVFMRSGTASSDFSGTSSSLLKKMLPRLPCSSRVESFAK